MRLTLALIALAVCGFAQPKKEPVVFRHFTMIVPWTLDPHLENHANVTKLQWQLFEAPLEMQLDAKGRIQTRPAICEYPKISKDGRSMTLVVRPRVRFHDDPCFPGGKGRELDGSDIKYMFMRHADPNVRSKYFDAFVSGRIAGLDAWRERCAQQGFTDYDAKIAGLAVDGKSIKLGLTAPYPQLPALLTQMWAAIVPREAIQRYGSGFGDNPVGSGPFRFKEKDALGSITMVKNPTYRMYGKPAIDELRFEHIPNLDDRTKRFENGDLHILDVWSHNHDQLIDRRGAVRSHLRKKGVRFARGTEMEISYMFFNFENKLLAKKEVRQAICLAVNRHAFVRKAVGPIYKLADTPFPYTFPEAALFDGKPYEYGKTDIKKAKELLAKAGHPGGKGLPEFVVDFPGHLGPKEKDAWEVFKTDLGRIGIKVQNRQGPFDEFLKRARNRDLQMGWVRWYADYPDVENFLLLFRSNADPLVNWNYGAYKNEEYDQVYDEMAKLYPGAERDQKVRRLVEIVQEDCPWLMLFYSTYDRLVAKGVMGYRYNVVNLSLRDVYIYDPPK